MCEAETEGEMGGQEKMKKQKREPANERDKKKKGEMGKNKKKSGAELPKQTLTHH